MGVGIGDRVMAIMSVSDGVVHAMGEGEFLGHLVPGPDVVGGEFFHELGIKNPAIKLDNGETVWGFECWWGSVAALKKKFEGMVWEVVPVSVYRQGSASSPVEGEDGCQ